MGIYQEIYNEDIYKPIYEKKIIVPDNGKEENGSNNEIDKPIINH